ETAGELVVIGGGPVVRESLVDDVDGELARHLTRGGPAHAIADAEHRPAFPHDLLAVALHQAPAAPGQVRDQEVVLVVLAYLSDVGPSKDAEANFTRRRHRHDRGPPVSKSSRNRCCPTRRWSPWKSSRSPRTAR